MGLTGFEPVAARLWAGRSNLTKLQAPFQARDAANRARTCDIMVNSHALYQLSYGGILQIGFLRSVLMTLFDLKVLFIGGPLQSFW